MTDNATPRYWISSSDKGHLRTIHVQSRTGNLLVEDKDEENWQNIVFFSTREEADCFLHKMMLFIKDNYPNAKDWFPELNEIMKNNE